MRLIPSRAARAHKELAAQLGGTEPPTFPALTLRILEKLRDSDVEFDEVADAIRWDAGLTVKVLGTVNSAAYAPRRPIEDIRHAVTILGRAQLESVVLGVAASTAIRARAARGLEPSRFWRAAAERATLARQLASRLHPATERESFTSGLLLDLALPLMVTAFGETYSDVLEEWHASPGKTLFDIERASMGRTHCEIGHMLAEAWQLPSGLVHAIAFHHEDPGGRPVPAEFEPQPAIRLVASWRETSPSAEGEEDIDIEELVEMARSEYGLEPDWVVAAIETARIDANDLAGILATK